MANVTLTLHGDLIKRVSENEIEVVIFAEGKTYDVKETLKRAGYKFGEPIRFSRAWHKAITVYAPKREEELGKIEGEIERKIEITRFVQSLLNNEVEAVNAVVSDTCKCYQFDFEYYERVGGRVAPGTVNSNKFSADGSGYKEIREKLQEIL